MRINPETNPLKLFQRQYIKKKLTIRFSNNKPLAQTFSIFLCVTSDLKLFYQFSGATKMIMKKE